MSTKQNSKKILTRRSFLQIAGMSGVGLALAACAPAATPAPTAAPKPTDAPIATQAPIPTPEKVAPTEAPPTTVEPTKEVPAVVEPKTLIFGAEAIGETLEPGLWNGFGCSNVLDNIYERITQPGDKFTDPAKPARCTLFERR